MKAWVYPLALQACLHQFSPDCFSSDPQFHIVMKQFPKSNHLTLLISSSDSDQYLQFAHRMYVLRSLGVALSVNTTSISKVLLFHVLINIATLHKVFCFFTFWYTGKEQLQHCTDKHSTKSERAQSWSGSSTRYDSNYKASPHEPLIILDIIIFSVLPL